MSGLESFDLLYAATRLLPFNSVVDIHPVDFCALAKLTPDMLAARGFGSEYADAASSALLRGKIDDLAWAMGLRLRIQRWAPPL